MRKIQIIVTGLLISSLVTAVCAQTKTYKIGILLWHEARHDEEALAGFKEGIELSGIPHEFDIKRAYDDETKSRQFIREWIAGKFDLICTIGTKGTLWAMEETKDIPIVFTAVTNPVISGITDSWDSSGRNVTGSSNWIIQETKMAVFKECLPHLKTLGVIYNPDNPVPLAEISGAKKVCQATGITLKEATIKDINEVEKAVESLVSQNIDALWVPIEVLVYKNMIKVGRVTIPKKLPVLSSTLEGIEKEGEEVSLAAVAVDYKALGRLCVPSAIEILTEGKKPKDIPIKTLSNPQIVINANAAEEIGYKIPPAFLAKASNIIRGFEGKRIVIAGTGDSQELLRALAKTLEEKLKGGEINVSDSVGSGGGIKAVIAGKADFARVARPLNKGEQELGLTYKIFAKSPVVFVVHPSVTDIENLTTKQIIDIYSGAVIDWSVLGSKSGKIYPVTRESGDSSSKILEDNIPGFKDISESVAKVIYDTPSTVAALAGHRNTVGFLPLPATKGTDLRVLKVDDVYPSIENVNNGKYKMVIPFAIVYKGETSGLAKRFVDFLYSEQGKDIIGRMGAVPTE